VTHELPRRTVPRSAISDLGYQSAGKAAVIDPRVGNLVEFIFVPPWLNAEQDSPD
jgi:hypothetical protein